MHISFRHANPENGNESFLLRFGSGSGEASCVLVDAGHGVDLDSLLGPGDRLSAICLTHAHLDHYAELAAAHRGGAPILTAPATAAILDDVFDVAGSEYGVVTSEEVVDAIVPIEGWTTVEAGVEVHPVPAGHVPGAVGFLFRVADDDRTHLLLATGDFTLRRAGGFPGFDHRGFADVDVLFMTGSTRDDFETSLTAGLGTALEYAHGGSRTLVGTSGLVGVQVAYLLSTLAGEYDLHVPVRVVGHVAKLFETLGYDRPDVETVPSFEHTDECLEPGAIVVAGPEIPTEGSSGRLFGVLREDPSACAVQLIGSGRPPVASADCALFDYELVNHPTRETLVDVHDAIDPIETVVTHRHGGAKSRFNDLSSVVWGAGDTDEYTLFDGENWRLPPWMGGGTVDRDRGRSGRQFVDTDHLTSLSGPSFARHDEPDLEAEGVDRDRIETHLNRGPDAAASLDVPGPTDGSPTADPDRETTTTTMTTDSSDSTENDDARGDARQLAGLVRTTGPEPHEELDPALRAALEDGSLTEEDLEAARAALEQIAKRGATNGDEEPTGSDERKPSGKREDEDAADGASVDAEMVLDLNPIAVALAERAVSRERDDGARYDSVEEVVAAAVEAYVVALLAGEASGGEDERFAVDVTTSSAVAQALDGVVADDDRFESTTDLVVGGVAYALGDERDVRREVRGPGEYRRHLDAIRERPEYVFDDVEGIVEAALVRFSTHT